MKTCLNPLGTAFATFIATHILFVNHGLRLVKQLSSVSLYDNGFSRTRCNRVFSIPQLAMLQLLRQIQRCQGPPPTLTSWKKLCLYDCMSRCKLAKGSCDMAHSPCSWKADVDHRLLGCKTVRQFQNSRSLLSLLRQEHAKGYRNVQSMLHISTETAQKVWTASLNQPAMPTPSQKFIIWFRS